MDEPYKGKKFDKVHKVDAPYKGKLLDKSTKWMDPTRVKYIYIYIYIKVHKVDGPN